MHMVYITSGDNNRAQVPSYYHQGDIGMCIPCTSSRKP